MASFGDLMVTLGIDVSKYERGMEKADMLAKKLGNTMKQAGRQSQVAFSLISAGAVMVTKSLLEEASVAEELESKFRVVFKGMIDVTNEWITNFSDKVGRSKTEVKGYMADLQNLFVGMGSGRQAAADLSKEVVSLSVDLASFNNLSDSETIKRFTSALMGESQAAKGLGASILEAQLKVAAAAMGIGNYSNKMSELIKMQVRLKAIQMQSADAIGDAERTIDSYTNQVKVLQANLKELRIELGTQLLPQFTKFISEVNKVDMEKAFSPETIEQMKQVSLGVFGAISAIAGLTTAIALLTNPLFLVSTTSALAFKSINDNISDLKPVFESMGDWIDNIYKGLLNVRAIKLNLVEGSQIQDLAEASKDFDEIVKAGGASNYQLGEFFDQNPIIKELMSKFDLNFEQLKGNFSGGTGIHNIKDSSLQNLSQALVNLSNKLNKAAGINTIGLKFDSIEEKPFTDLLAEGVKNFGEGLTTEILDAYKLIGTTLSDEAEKFFEAIEKKAKDKAKSQPIPTFTGLDPISTTLISEKSNNDIPDIVKDTMKGTRHKTLGGKTLTSEADKAKKSLDDLASSLRRLGLASGSELISGLGNMIHIFSTLPELAQQFESGDLAGKVMASADAIGLFIGVAQGLTSLIKDFMERGKVEPLSFSTLTREQGLGTAFEDFTSGLNAAEQAVKGFKERRDDEFLGISTEGFKDFLGIGKGRDEIIGEYNTALENAANADAAIKNILGTNEGSFLGTVEDAFNNASLDTLGKNLEQQVKEAFKKGIILKSFEGLFTPISDSITKALLDGKLTQEEIDEAFEGIPDILGEIDSVTNQLEQLGMSAENQSEAIDNSIKSIDEFAGNLSLTQRAFNLEKESLAAEGLGIPPIQIDLNLSGDLDAKVESKIVNINRKNINTTKGTDFTPNGGVI